MMKQWLIRRAVRRPVSLFTTAAISSSVWRLPFIRASASAFRTSSTALAADSWLNAASTMRNFEMSMPAFDATSRMRAEGPTRIGAISPTRAASTAPLRDDSSHGWTTAVGVGASPLQRAISWSYFSCDASMVTLLPGKPRRLRGDRGHRNSASEERRWDLGPTPGRALHENFTGIRTAEGRARGPIRALLDVAAGDCPHRAGG